ncbi:MAG: hypothetical protein HY896_01620, partial [Deltaproteobacteria bacterium]|nr:hypothetical protein [Deltaproteobacteria bacterium]
MRAVCTSCHDDTTVTLPHVLGQTSGTTELCASCHTTGLTFGPDQVHRPGRPGPFPVE